MVAGPGAGDVEQAPPLVVAHLLVDRLGGVEVGGPQVLAQPELVPAVGRPQHLDAAAVATRLAGHAGHDDDRELHALGRVDRHDAQRLRVGLGQHRLGGPGGVAALPLCPGQVGAQPAVLGLGPGAGLVDDEAQPPPHVPGARAVDRHLEHPPVVDEPGEHLARRQPGAVVVQPPQVRHAARTGWVGGSASGTGRGCSTARRPASTSTGRRRRSRTGASAAR